jgi:ketosteroid isomerase-like protein
MIPMQDSVEQELLKLNQTLLDSIARSDWAVYEGLCDSSLTAFEPEAQGQLVEGLAFHRFYFQTGAIQKKHLTTMCSPKVRVLGDVAVITYVRLNQEVADDGAPATTAFEETRIWHRREEGWKHVHFHRSLISH